MNSPTFNRTTFSPLVNKPVVIIPSKVVKGRKCTCTFMILKQSPVNCPPSVSFLTQDDLSKDNILILSTTSYISCSVSTSESVYLYLYLISISGDPKSEVYGYFTNEGIFSGMVYTETDTIHIEPSHRFGVNTSHNVSIVQWQ